MKRFIIFLLLISSLAGFGQNHFAFKYTGIYPVIENGDSLVNAWGGGLNQPQFSKVDLNLDGELDLVAFDRTGYRIIPYLSVDVNGTKKYRYAPGYIKNFPPIEHWMLLADYNCDGKMDIFSYAPGGIGVYENVSDTVLKFQWALSTSNLRSDYGSGKINLYVYNTDLPAIADVDYDGDLDIFTFGFGASVQWHENLANCGLDFALNTSCWGRFEEGQLNNTLFLDACIGINKNASSLNPPLDNIAKGQHAGSTELMIDLDGDSLMDHLIGDVSFNNAVAAYNTGFVDSAFCSAQDTTFPSYNTPIDVNIFPAFFYEDIDFDGEKDLMVASNQQLGSKTMNNVWFYKNTNTTANPTFSLQDTAYFQRDMIELGEGATPRLVDLNTDGLLDLIVANYGMLKNDGDYKSFISYYKNTGTQNSPKFELVEKDLSNISGLNLGRNMVPTFGDLDGDLDQDMIVGAVDGKLHYFENQGTFLIPDFVIQTPNFQGIDVGGSSAPHLFDVDDDGNLDLLIGEEQGNVNYYKNDGVSPLSYTLINENFGGVNVKSQFTNEGYSVPVMTKNNDTLNLFVGSYDRGIIQYDSIASVMSKPPIVIAPIGTGTTASTGVNVTPFGASKRNGRNQILYRASDLKAQGFSYGKITAVSFNIPTFPGNIISQGFTIKMKNVNMQTVSGWETDMTTVFDYLYGFSSGWNNIQLGTPFLWDGQSDLLVEICFSKNFQSSDLHVTCTDVGYAANAYGDIANWNGVTQDGCLMPYLGNSSLRPNMEITLVPTFVQSEVILKDGYRNAVDFGNLTGDQYLDGIMGNYCGGVTFYKGIEWVGQPIDVKETPWARQFELNVYPNPATNIVRVEVPEDLNLNQSELNVYDITGRLVLNKPAEEAIMEVSTNSLSPGLYIFMLSDKKSLYTERVVIQRQ